MSREVNWQSARIQRGIARRMGIASAYVGELARLPGRLLQRQEARRIQREAFAREQYGRRRKLVIFLIPGIQTVTGGGLQIFSLNRLSREYFKGSDTDSLICWLPGEGWQYHRFEGFDNDVTVFPLDMVLESCAPDCELLFHLPEYAAERFCNVFGWECLARVGAKHNLTVNVLEQNIEVMPNPHFFKQLSDHVPHVSSTVGSTPWATDGERRRLGIPLHLLPTWYYPDDAPWQPYESKQNLMIVSPDENPNRDLVLDAVRAALPDLRIQVIWGLKYEQYLELERKAKWSITFGEGLDGYFYGPAFRGGVPFGVRNVTFDLPGLEDKRTIYESYEAMAGRIVEDIRALDSKDVYEAYNRSLRGPIAEEFGPGRTSQALIDYYRGEWTLP